jgi:hypothetical protein
VHQLLMVVVVLVLVRVDLATVIELDVLNTQTAYSLPKGLESIEESFLK